MTAKQLKALAHLIPQTDVDAAATEILLSAGVMIETEDHFFIRREGDGQAESTLKA